MLIYLHVSLFIPSAVTISFKVFVLYLLYVFLLNLYIVSLFVHPLVSSHTFVFFFKLFIDSWLYFLYVSLPLNLSYLSPPNSELFLTKSWLDFQKFLILLFVLFLFLFYFFFQLSYLIIKFNLLLLPYYLVMQMFFPSDYLVWV